VSDGVVPELMTVVPELMTARAKDGVLRVDFVVHGKHSWLTFSGVGLDQLREVLDSALRQREASK
jgi:hypothetical protein